MSYEGKNKKKDRTFQMKEQTQPEPLEQPESERIRNLPSENVSSDRDRSSLTSGTSGLSSGTSSWDTGLAGSSNIGSSGYSGSSGLSQPSSGLTGTSGSSGLGAAGSAHIGSTGISGAAHIGKTNTSDVGSSGLSQPSSGSSFVQPSSSSSFAQPSTSSGFTQQPASSSFVQQPASGSGFTQQPSSGSGVGVSGTAHIGSTAISGSAHIGTSSSGSSQASGLSQSSNIPSSSSGVGYSTSSSIPGYTASSSIPSTYSSTSSAPTSYTSVPSSQSSGVSAGAEVSSASTGPSMLDTAKAKWEQAKETAASTFQSAKIQASQAAERWTQGKDKHQVAQEVTATEHVIAPEVLAKKSTKPEEELSNEVLVCFVDGSLSSDKAFSYAVKHKKEGDILYFVNIPRALAVAQKGITVMKSLDTTVLDEVNRNLRDQSHQIIQHYEDKVRNLKIDRANGVTLDIASSPEDSAVDFLKEKGATLAFVGTRGMGSVKKMFAGSFSEYLVNQAPCAVMVVRCDPSEYERSHM